MRAITSIATLVLFGGIAGCATTKDETTGTSMKAPLCEPGGDRISVVSFWQAKWRPEQKEPEAREFEAARGIHDFFASTTCVGKNEIRRLTGKEPNDQPADAELVRLAQVSASSVDRVLLITVRELGPKLLIGLPVIVEGGTEVVLEIRAIDAHSSQTIANFKTHWQNGGTFVVKGVETLPSDMKSALQAALMPGQAAQ
jgi:hypothetical protein